MIWMRNKRKKAAKQTAEVILTSYQKFMPVPFKKISSFNMRKMEKLNMSGDISLNMVVTEDGKTVRNYMEGVNQQVDELFVVTDEMKDDLRQPLIDCLMENNLALTPTQRLMLAAGSQVAQFTVQAIQLNVGNRDALNTFKQFKADDDAAGRTQPSAATPPPPPPPTQAEPSADEQVYEAPQTESDEAVILEEKYDAPDFGMDDYLNDKVKKEEIASVENGQITIEEIPNE